MKPKYTKHAIWRMRKRRITAMMVVTALKNPDREGIGYYNRNIIWKTFPRGKIKVVYKIEDGIVNIITAMWERGGPPCK